MTHTPGTWQAGKGTGCVISDKVPEDYKSGSGHDAIDYYGGFLIAESVADRDLNLIAAAPDLLAALTAINEYWESGNFTRKDSLWNPMKAAIKKATQTK